MENKRGVGGEGGNRGRNKEGKLFRDGSHDCRVILKPQALGISWSQWLNSQSLDSTTMLADGHRFHPRAVNSFFPPFSYFSLPFLQFVSV